MITVEIEQFGLSQLLIKLERGKAGVKSGLRSGIHAAAIHLSSVIKRDYLSGQVVNRRTGNLSRAVFAKMINDTTGMVGVGKEAPYGRFVNDGTRPHVIGPVNAKALRFSMGDRIVYARRVMHPGTKPTHFMEEALAASAQSIRRIIEERVNRGAKGESGE